MCEFRAVSPIDGRYFHVTRELAEIFSEMGLIRYRLFVELEYFMALSENQNVKLRKFSDEEKEIIRKICNLSIGDFKTIKDIERRTDHDVKAIEYFIKEKLKDTSLKDSLEWIHFSLTSEDTNNLAYGLMLSDGLMKIIVPKLESVFDLIEKFSQEYKEVPMLARTHGQPASPTTFGKEFKVFSSRLVNQINKLKNFEISVKLNGATGNYNAHYVSYPNIDWLGFTKIFVEKLKGNRTIKLKPNLITTQIEPGDSYAELFDILRRLNTILIDFNQDIWRYISDGWIKLRAKESEVGSSTMPHKINPIDFENSEGNLGLANALFTYFSTKLPVSRLQRDLSDSTVRRNFGVALSYNLIAYESVLRGLGKIDLDIDKVILELENHPEVISEAIQIILRREGFNDSYERLKEITRGRKLKLGDFTAFINSLDVPDIIKEELESIKPTNYVGIAKALVDI